MRRASTRSQIQLALQGCKDQNKVLIFCDRKATCDTLNDIYDDAPKYYSDAVNKDEALKYSLQFSWIGKAHLKII